jgi:hypothetical protein
MSTKTLIITAVISTGFLISCRKADIRPNVNNASLSEETIVNRGAVGVSSHESGTHKSISRHDGVRDIISITDPNNDEDRNKRKKGK